MSQNKKQNKNPVISPRPMTPGEISYHLKKNGLTTRDLAVRTGLRQSTVSNTIAGRINSDTVLGYLDDLGIKHHRPYDRNKMLRPYNPEEPA